MRNGNYKVKVVEILSNTERAIKAFGGVGQEFEVVSGNLTDLEGYVWSDYYNVKNLINDFEASIFYKVKLKEVIDSFKVRVEYSNNIDFGVVGEVFEIEDGTFVDSTGDTWRNSGFGFHNVDELNKYFSGVIDLKFSEYEEYPSFKVVVEETKSRSDWFGNTGTILDVIDGELIDLQGFNWANNDERYKNIDDVNNHVGFATNTKFKLYEEKEEDNTYNGKFRIVENIGELSQIVFGKVGSVFKVTNGTFMTKNETTWNNDTRLYKTFDEIKDHIEKEDDFETIIEEIVDKKFNGKFKVTKTVGRLSAECIGEAGDVIEVKDGVFEGGDGSVWDNNGIPFESFEEIKKYFSERDNFETLIEEVVREEDVKTPYNGTIRVVENVGINSESNFGGVGNIIVVKNGNFKDLKGFTWKYFSAPYTSFEEIESHFRVDDNFKTVFEEVSRYNAELYSLDNTMKGLTFDIPKPIALRDMTVEEIEKELGYKIRIVSSKEVK